MAEAFVVNYHSREKGIPPLLSSPSQAVELTRVGPMHFRRHGVTRLDWNSSSKVQKHTNPAAFADAFSHPQRGLDFHNSNHQLKYS